jgi:hypothetical protein
MRTIIWLLIRGLRLGPLILLVHPKSALRDLGWFASFTKRRSIDKLGSPIPWWTYGFISFLAPRLKNTFRALEFGCGASSIWLGKRVKEIVSIENHALWAAEIEKQATPNVFIQRVVKITDFDSYIKNIAGLFQIIIVDNEGSRMECAKRSLDLLADDGVLIWDNTNGPDWGTINSFMHVHGFREISFSGLTPQEIALSRTTVFYRANNCLGI